MLKTCFVVIFLLSNACLGSLIYEKHEVYHYPSTSYGETPHEYYEDHSNDYEEDYSHVGSYGKEPVTYDEYHPIITPETYVEKKPMTYNLHHPTIVVNEDHHADAYVENEKASYNQYHPVDNYKEYSPKSYDEKEHIPYDNYGYPDIKDVDIVKAHNEVHDTYDEPYHKEGYYAKSEGYGNSVKEFLSKLNSEHPILITIKKLVLEK